MRLGSQSATLESKLHVLKETNEKLTLALALSVSNSPTVRKGWLATTLVPFPKYMLIN